MAQTITIPHDAVEVQICARHSTILRRYHIDRTEDDPDGPLMLMLCPLCMQERAAGLLDDDETE